MRKLIDTTILIILLLGPAALLMSLSQDQQESPGAPTVEIGVDHELTHADDLAQMDFPRP